MTIFGELTKGLKFVQPRLVVLQTMAENLNRISCCPPDINNSGCFPSDYCNKCWQSWLVSEYKEPIIIDLL